MLFLVTAEVKGTPPPPSLESLQRGLATLERLEELRRLGTVLAAGVYAGSMGMCFTIDVASNNELHQIVSSLPTFVEAEWRTVPLVDIPDDIAVTRAALDHFGAAPQ